MPESTATLQKPSGEYHQQKSTKAITLAGILILGGLSAFGPLSTDMYLPALPMLSNDLHVSMAETQITLSAGILGLALGQLIAGPLSDTYGRKRPLILGILAFIIASILCIAAPNVLLLAVLRFVQGAAGAAGMVISTAIVRDLTSGNAMAKTLSLLMLVNGVAPIIAPVIGSQLLTITTWHGIFLTLAGTGALLLLAGIFGLKESLPPEQRQRGGMGATLSSFGKLFRNRLFLGYALSTGFAFTACIIYISFAPFVLQNIYGLNPQIFGLVFGINALAIVIVGQISGRLVGRYSARTLLVWGMSFFALGGVSLLMVTLAQLGLVGVLPSLFIMIASLGLIMPNAAALALEKVEAAGSGSALLGLLQLIIGPLVAPLIGLGGEGSPLPMAIGIAVFSLLTILVVLALTGQRKH